jgi:hypothetical protein
VPFFKSIFPKITFLMILAVVVACEAEFDPPPYVRPNEAPTNLRSAVSIEDSPNAPDFVPNDGPKPLIKKFPAFKVADRDVFIYAGAYDVPEASEWLTRGYTHIDEIHMAGAIAEGRHLHNRKISYKNRMRIMYDNTLGDGMHAPNFYKGIVPPPAEFANIVKEITGNWAAKKPTGEAANTHFDDGKMAEWQVIDFEFPYIVTADGAKWTEFNATWGKMATVLRQAFPYVKVTAGGLVQSAMEESWEPMDARTVLGYFKHLIFDNNARTLASKSEGSFVGLWKPELQNASSWYKKLNPSYFKRIANSDQSARQIDCKTDPAAIAESKANYYKRWTIGLVAQNEAYRRLRPNQKNLSWQAPYFEDCIGHPEQSITDDLAEGLPIWQVMTGGTGLLLWGANPTGRAVDFFTNGLYRLSHFNDIRNQSYQYLNPKISYDGKTFYDQGYLEGSGPTAKGLPGNIVGGNWTLSRPVDMTVKRDPIVRAVATGKDILIAAFDPTLEPGKERDVWVLHDHWVGKIHLTSQKTFLGAARNQTFSAP